MFSAGVFLAGGLLDLLPECIAQIEAASSTSYPVAALLAIGGFSAVLVMEEVVVWCQHRPPGPDYAPVPAQGPENQCCARTRSRTEAAIMAALSPRSTLLVDGQGHRHCGEAHGLGVVSADYGSGGDLEVGDGKVAAKVSTDKPKVSPNEGRPLLQLQVENGCETEAMCMKAQSGVGAYAIVVALSIHGIFEGLALGTTCKQDIFRVVLLAISAHGPVGSFALAIALLRSNVGSVQFWISVVIASIVTPLGVVIGLAIKASALVQGVTQGLAVGTFLYIGVVEILPKEMSHGSLWKLHKLLAYFVGLGMMAAITAIDK